MALTDRDLLAIIRQHRANSFGAEDGDLAGERATALDRYHGRPYGNEVEGRSQVVDRSTMEAVDWAMPSLMKIFTASGSIAEFAPLGQEDEAAAQQESDYVNHVMMQENHGFMVLHDAVLDALLLKNGYTKEFWEDETTTEEETYTGLTLEQFTLMMQRLQQDGYAKVEVLGSEERTEYVQTPQGDMPLQVWDVKLRITKKCGAAKWMAAPTEEWRVSKNCRGSLRDSPFTEHVTKKTRTELIKLGMPSDFVYSLPAYNETPSESQTLARDSVDDESEDADPVNDKSMDEIEYCEAYLMVDWDGDGVAELRKIVTVGDKIPPGEEWNERLHENPATGWVAKRMSHRHVGRSVYDELCDIEEILTTLKRQMLDSIYYNNMSELVINEDANIRDFMTRQPGGVKRIKGSNPVGNAVMPLVTKPIIGEVLPVIDYFTQSRQKLSGVDANTGVDPDVLQQTTKAAFLENMNRLGAKLEMMARMLAETGVKESVLKIHAILRRHQDIPKQVQLRGKWTTVNPRDWKERTDVRVKVGLGTGNEEEKRMKLGMLAQFQGQLLQMLMGAPPMVYAKAYALFEDMAKTLGAEMPEKYAIAPNSPEHQQLMREKQQAQQQGDPRTAIEAAKVQQQGAIKAQELRQQGALEQQRMRMQAEVDRNRQEMEAQQQQAKMQAEMQLRQIESMLEMREKRMEAAMDMQFQKWRAQLDAAVKIEVANIASETNAENAATMAATNEIASEVTQGGMPMHGGGMAQPNGPEDGQAMME